MNQGDVIGYHTGSFAMADQIIGNADYNNGVPFGARFSDGTGRASLGMLSAAVLGVMFFYIATRGRQF